MTMEYSNQPKKSKSTGIQFEMDAETNRLLEKSANENVRTKKGEAKFRLADHLRRFPDISNINISQKNSLHERESNS